jgi:undecaprenyl phosphate-alpha-L-ara4N flippase subunit ArnE
MTAGWGVWLGVLITPILISTGQVLFKMTGLRLAERKGSGMLSLATDPYFVSALALYGVGTLIWIYVLRHLPLGQAYPFMALSFVLVPIASVLVFGESLGLRYWLGAGLIVAGMLVIRS